MSFKLDLISMETGLRGYELSGDDQYLEPYEAGKAQLEKDLLLLAGYRQMYPRLNTVVSGEVLPAIRQLQDYFANQIALIKNGQNEAASQRVSIGRTYMDQFRTAHEKVILEIGRIARDAYQSASDAERLARIVTIIGGMAAFIVGVISMIIFNRVTRAEAALLETLKLDAAMIVVSKDAWNASGDDLGDAENNPLFETIYSIGYPAKLPAMQQSELYGAARRVLQENRMLESVRNVTDQERGFHLGIQKAADYYFPLMNDRQKAIGFLLLTGYLTSSFDQKIRLAHGFVRQFGLAFMAQQTNEERRRQGVKLEQLNKQLQREKRMIEDILESTNEGMVMCDGNGHILYLNQRMKAFLNLSHEVGESIVTAIRIWNDTPTSGQVLSAVEGLLRGKSDHITERFYYTTDDGQMRHVELFATKVGDSSKQPGSGFLFIVRDRTEEEKIDEVKNEFISIVSHELRTPLASVLGFIEIMLHRQLTPEKQRKYLQTVYKEANRLSTLINDFLDLQRMESGKQVYHFVPVELGALLREAAEHWKAEQTHEIRLTGGSEGQDVHQILPRGQLRPQTDRRNRPWAVDRSRNPGSPSRLRHL